MKTDIADVAVLIPCYNEALTIAKVVGDFRAALPAAMIVVYDNNSTDGTADCALEAGAFVRFEPLQGKGNVVRRMFADIEADIYVLVDGDDTYEATDAPMLIERLQRQNLDMINGRRVTAVAAAYRPGHRFGNWFLTAMVSKIFGSRLADMLSGYKVFSRRFVKSFPALASGFEIETELVVHALELRMPIAEVDTEYRERPEGSASKLRTVRDGMRIMRTIIRMIKEERPLEFFSVLFLIVALLSLLMGSTVVTEYVATGMVPGLPAIVLATGMMLLAFLLLACGLILDTVTVARRELKRLHYVMASPTGLTHQAERKRGLKHKAISVVA